MKADPDETRPATGRNKKEFDKSFVRSIVWTGVGKVVSQLLGWVATFIVARLLVPEDYGLFGMATVFLGVVTLLSESGIGITIVTLRNLDKAQVEQFNTLAVLLGIAGFLACAIAAIPLGTFFHSEALPLIVLILGTTFPITGLKVVPRALLQMDQRFKLLGALEVANVLVLSSSTIIFALVGFRHWTLVLGALLSAFISTALTVWYRPQRFRWPQWESLHGALTFTKYQVGGNLLWYTYSNSDHVVAGRLLGATELGVYALAMSIVNSIPEKITAIITGVTPAFFAVLHDDPKELKRYLLRLTEVLSIVTFPALFGLAVVADDFVLLALGTKWMGVVVPLRLLAIYTAINATSQLPSRVLTVRGENQFLFHNGALLAVILPVSFVVGSQWGPAGIAAAWVVVYPLTRIPVLRRLAVSIDVSAMDYVKAHWPATSACAAMIVAVLLLKSILPAAMPLGIKLLLEVLVGAAVYVFLAFLLFRQRIEILLQLQSGWRR